MEQHRFRFGAKYLSFFKWVNAFNKYDRMNGCYHFWTVRSTRLTYKVPGKIKYVKGFMEESESNGSCMRCLYCNCSCVIFRNKESFNSDSFSSYSSSFTHFSDPLSLHLRLYLSSGVMCPFQAEGN